MNFKTVVYTLSSAKIGKAFDGSKLVFLTDLHNHSYGEDNKYLIQAILKLKPAAVLVGGDMMVVKGKKDISVPLKLLSQLAGRLPVFYGNGNHELRMKWEMNIYGDLYTVYKTALQDLGVVYLENTSALLTKDGEALRISGLDIPRFYYRKFKKDQMGSALINRTLGKADKAVYQILLGHNPNQFESYAAWGADLSLAGHLHGGVMQIPGIGGVISPDFEIFPRYASGLFEKDGKRMVVSSGLGTHSVNIRINNPPQLVVLELMKGDNG